MGPVHGHPERRRHWGGDRHLASRDVVLKIDDTTSDKVKFGTVTDPDGNAVTLVEPRSNLDPNASRMTAE
jgi:methyl coenzyme M reductase subunit D